MHLRAECQQNTNIWCSFTLRPRSANPAPNWDLFTKYSSIKSWEQTNISVQLRCCPGKTIFIHCSLNAGFFGKLKKVIFPSQPKTHSFSDRSCVSFRRLRPLKAAYVIKDVLFKKRNRNKIDWCSLWSVKYCHFFLTLQSNGYIS